MERNNGAEYQPSAYGNGQAPRDATLDGSPTGWTHRADGPPTPEDRLDYLYETDKSAASVEEISRTLFRSAVRADREVVDRSPHYHLPPEGGRSRHRYWVVDRDKVEFVAKILGHVIFWAAIGAVAVTVVIGLIYG